MRITQLLSTGIPASASLRTISLLKIGRSPPKMSGWPAIAASVIALDGVSSWLGGGWRGRPDGDRRFKSQAHRDLLRLRSGSLPSRPTLIVYLKSRLAVTCALLPGG
jgi:hypothetical protein